MVKQSVSEWKKNGQERLIEQLRDLCIRLFEEKEKELEEKKEQGVVDFKLFIFEQYYLKIKKKK